MRPPLSEPQGSDPDRTRDQLVHEIANERIRLDPADRDAWFALASAQAGLKDARGALASLDKLAALDPKYPGLWLLKAKLHARLGEADEWRQARMKADEYMESGADLAPCPVCGTPIAAQSSLCPHCGSHTESKVAAAEEPKGAAKAEMPEPDRGAVPQTRPSSAVSAPATQGPVLRTPRGEGRRGLTNGLLLERKGARPAAAAGGRTNGLGGRTNGLTDGLGRTNGLRDGAGRASGLTNGIGRTNGLANGLAKVAVVRSPTKGFRRARWERLGLIAALVVLVLLVPIVFFWNGPTVSYPIRVDGQFADWSGVAKVSVPPQQAAANPDTRITRVAVVDNVDFLATYLQVQGIAAAGGPAPQRITNQFYAFIDVDRSRSTGYQVQGIGADRMVRISTWGGQVVSASFLEFDSSRAHQDWNGWAFAGSVGAAASGNQMEFQLPWSDLGVSPGAVQVAFAARSWDGVSSAADVVATSARSYVVVAQDTRAPTVLSGASPILSTFTFRAVGSDMTILSLNVTLQGTLGAASLSAVDLVDGSGGLIGEVTPSAVEHFTLNSFVVPSGSNRTITVRPKVGTADGTTVGAFLANLQDVAVPSGGVAFIGPVRTPDTLAYVGTVPSAPAVDGGFSDWPSIAADAAGDVQPIWNPDVDLTGYAFQGSSGSTYFMAQVTGTALNGTMIPALNPSYVPPANGTGNGTTPPPPPRPENGTDCARFYLDTDGSGTTGYQIGGIGADYLLEITGKEGVILSTSGMRFRGATPYDWAWTPLGFAQATKDRSRIEAALAGVVISNASRAYFEMGGWNSAKDGSSPSSPPMVVQALTVSGIPSLSSGPTRGAGGDSSAVRPLDIPGNQNWYFTSAAPSPNSNSCNNNYAASTTPGTSATSTTLTGTQSICWYTPTGQPSSTIAGPWDFTLDISRVDSTQTFVPNAQGTYNQWGVSGCVLGSSFNCVSSNDGNTSYIVSSNNNPNLDTFNISDWTSPPSPLNITNVRLSVWCYAASAQAGKVATYLKNGTNELAGTATSCSKGPYTEVASNYPNYPWGTSRPWTAADINGLEIGARDADNQNREIRVTFVQLTVSYTPIYSVSILLCTQTNCGAGNLLYGPTNVARYGNNITITTGSIPAQTLQTSDRIRFQIALVSGTSVTVNYNGPTIPGTSDSRASIPIPEFGDVALPIGTALVIAILVPRWSRRRKGHPPAG